MKFADKTTLARLREVSQQIVSRMKAEDRAALAAQSKSKKKAGRSAMSVSKNRNRMSA